MARFEKVVEVDRTQTTLRGCWRLLVCVVSLAAVLPPSCLAADPSNRQFEFFESRIRPVLVAQCYECHNSETAEGGLAVDHRQALLAGGENGAVIVPGNPQESRLLAILRHEIEGLEMPQGAPKLDDRTVADFERWIANGAADPRDAPPSSDELATATSWDAILEKRKSWWSFQPIGNPPIPAVDAGAWSNHPIDRFVLARLSSSGLQPGSRAEPHALVRRLFFVLIGLPPTPNEAEQWSAIVTGHDGYEQLVDHMLDRPEFGERWARHWMDWIRYAESHGSEGDPEIDNAWHYRDYLIRALNDDVPYDQLVREHIAGDLLERPRIDGPSGINESLIGPAHWRMVFHGFAPTDALDEKVRFIDDQINTFSKAFLGLTISCARCHDHKFDAISQRDYYALFGILGSCRPGRVAIETDEVLHQNRDRLAELKPRIREALADDWLQPAGTLHTRLLNGSGTPSDGADPHDVLHPWFQVQRDVEGGMEFRAAWQRRVDAWKAAAARRVEASQDGAVRVWNLGEAADNGRWFSTGTGLSNTPNAAGEFAVAVEGDEAVTGIYPSGVYSHALSTKHAARLESEDVELDGAYQLWLQVIGDGGAMARYVVQDYPRSGTVYPVTGLAPTWSWQTYDLTYWDGDTIHIELSTAMDAPLLVQNRPRSWFGIRQAMLVPHGQAGPPADTQEHLDPIFQAAAQSPPDSFDELAACWSEAMVQALDAWKAGTIDDAQASFLGQSLRQGLLPNRLHELRQARPLVEEYRLLEAEIAVPTRVPGLAETVAQDHPLYHRGDHRQPTEVVPRRFLEAVDATPYDTPLSGRLQLADDLLRDDNPLTRRVIVNRLWHHLFGQGIVRTPDNFGSLGQLPTHPDLLDWLATRFVEDDWSLKRMIRFIVTSKTWQLDSRASTTARQVDPENRLLSHAPVRRLEAEAIRDTLLQVCGDLQRDLFGKSVPHSSNRRSVYVEVKRNALTPFLRVFDFPEPFTATGRRDATNVPAQALAMLNDEFVAARAAAWTKRLLRDSELGTDEQRLQQMFLAAFGRPAEATELDRLASYLNATRQRYRRLAGELADLRQQIERRRDAIQGAMAPIRERLLNADAVARAQAQEDAPAPIARWEFDRDFDDVVGGLPGTARDGAHLENGALVLDGRHGHVVTEPLKRALREKTLEAWVQLGTLDQRGGGVMTVQSRDGAIFDAIVFAEQSPRQWLAGSDHFRRTRPFDGIEESEAADRPVHVAVVYHADGRIVGYRDGRPYGAAFSSEGPVEFKPQEAIVSFGVRHLPPTGNRLLNGRIFQAHLYDRALTDVEIAATSRLAGNFVTEEQVKAALPAEQRAEVERYEHEIAHLEAQIDALEPLPASLDEQAVWTDLAQALFGFKEFIYIK